MFTRIICIAFLLLSNPVWIQEKSLVRVTFPSQDENGETHQHSCTGFVVDSAKGLALTAEHCVPKGDDDQVFVDGEATYVVAKNADLALVKVEPLSRPPLDIGGDLDILDPVIVIGYGYGDLHRFRRNVSSLTLDDTKKKSDLECKLVALDGPLAPGMSGGPILKDGKVVAISQATAPAIGLGCNAKEIKRFIKEAK